MELCLRLITSVDEADFDELFLLGGAKDPSAVESEVKRAKLFFFFMTLGEPGATSLDLAAGELRRRSANLL